MFAAATGCAGCAGCTGAGCAGVMDGTVGSGAGFSVGLVVLSLLVAAVLGAALELPVALLAGTEPELPELLPDVELPELLPCGVVCDEELPSDVPDF